MFFDKLKLFLLGKPFPSSMDQHERLDNIRALAIFASDPISSNAYATEAIMSVLIVLGSGALSMTLPLALGVAFLVLIVIMSYIQTILHYPDGGGAYTVSKDNLGEVPSLISAAALLIDYVLTVAVSISAGVHAVTSAFPSLYDHRVLIALSAIVLITWINLRGVRESGTIFALPTYAFVAGVFIVIVLGLLRSLGWFGLSPIVSTAAPVPPSVSPIGFAYIWLILRAFAGGCTALTGIEAISNGTKAFKPPESRNAIITMVVMGVMAMSLFIGITFLSTRLSLVPNDSDTILSQMTRQITNGGFLYYWVQFSTFAILFLAANTGFQAFPQLSSFLAKDRFLPRWLSMRGSRLVFSAGIVLLTVLASLLIIFFKADEIAMLPLYALGVMLSFSLSQAGMFRLMGRIMHLKPDETLKTKVTTVHYDENARTKQIMNAVGAITTFLVFLILLLTKFKEGAWIVALLIPILVIVFYTIQRHYKHVADSLSTEGLTEDELTDLADVVMIPIEDIHRGTLQALKYAQRISSDVRALVVVTSEDMKSRLLERWQRFPNITGSIKLIFIDYDYRDILTPLVDYILEVNNIEFTDQLTTIVIPEFIPKDRAAMVLHNQTARALRRRLRHNMDIVIVDVLYHIGDKI